MSEQIRFYLDIHIPKAVAVALQRRGIDVVRGQDVGAEDDDGIVHLQRAATMGRVLVSRDSDFVMLGWSEQHAGVIKFSQAISMGGMITTLTEVHAVLMPAELRDRVEYY